MSSRSFKTVLISALLHGSLLFSTCWLHTSKERRGEIVILPAASCSMFLPGLPAQFTVLILSCLNQSNVFSHFFGQRAYHQATGGTGKMTGRFIIFTKTFGMKYRRWVDVPAANCTISVNLPIIGRNAYPVSRVFNTRCRAMRTVACCSNCGCMVMAFSTSQSLVIWRIISSAACWYCL